MPSILASLRSADPLHLGAEIDALVRAGVDGLHLDVMDGNFVPDLCLGPSIVTATRARSSLLLDVHLLIANPLEQIEAYAKAGADRISVHLEAVGDTHAKRVECLRAIEAAGVRPGLALFPGTPIEELEPYLDLVALVNPLGVDPRDREGFCEETPSRIRRLAAARAARGLEFVIQGDGGVFWNTRDAMVEAGADELVGGFPIFSAEDRGAAVGWLRDGDRPADG